MVRQHDVQRAASGLADMFNTVLLDTAPTRTALAEVADINYMASDGYVFAKMGSSTVRVMCDPGLRLRVGEMIWVSKAGPESHRVYFFRIRATTRSGAEGELGQRDSDPGYWFTFDESIYANLDGPGRLC